ncbi:MAG TPA: sn-glycerol-3-phosphate ABC transporter ATP-binding protein UgpC [Kaistia sp.]|nr:sn-glycerol-3-phosphate ABC transporter ATP-binding protein UgpC [Kaistia sp.]
MAKVTLSKLDKAYESFHAVHAIDLEIPDKAFVVLVGPSGCGKSTTLRMIAGLEDMTGGVLHIGDRVVNDLAPGERDIAMVFQNYALYPHMTVRSNIAFGLKQRKLPKAEIDSRVAKAAKMLQIEALLDRKPRALSGGQRQRVAMGRAMVRDPSVFLFDEPLSNLDAKLRVQMRTEIKRIHQANPTTSIYVTHDQIEAMTLADIVVVMNKGRIEQFGPPQELYHHPATKFVAGFIGSPAMNFFEVDVAKSRDVTTLALTNGDKLTVPPSRAAIYAPYVGRRMIFGIRPEHLHVAGKATGAITAEIEVLEPLGQETLVYFKIAGTEASTQFDPDVKALPGQKFPLYPDMDKAHLIDPETDLVVSAKASS